MMIGSDFSGYQILEKLGGGNTGVVYKAFDSNKNRHVAVKILPNDFLLTKEKKARFLRESEATALLRHDAIAKIYRAGSFNNCWFLAMEYVDGRTYSEIISENPEGVPLDRFYDLVLPVLSGVAFAHQNHLAHRDLKPDNLKITHDGEPKILDFGLVKFLNNQPQGSGSDSFQTMAGMVVGSAGYMSPEQAGGHKLDERTDIFSLGILMYELLSGKNPFLANNVFATISKILTANPISLELLRPDIPLSLGRIILKCLHKDMSERYPNASSLYHAIAEVKAQP